MDKQDKDQLLHDYNTRYERYGYSPKTLGWDKGKQEIRFSVLTSQFQINDKKILDIGCGFGDLHSYLSGLGYAYEYCGIDIVENLIQEAQKRHPQKKFILGDFLEYDFPDTFDFAVASGIFNRKFHGKLSNYEFIEQSIAKALGLVRDGIAFDFLSDNVDYTYEHTFHSNPSEILKIAYKYSRNILLRNDYMPFEFSLFIFKDDTFDKNDTLFWKYKKGL